MLGFLLFTAVMALLWAEGAYHPSGWGTVAGLGGGAIVVLPEAIVEDVLVRGFLFRLVETVTGTWWAVALTSALFGLAHAANPGASVTSSIAIALEAGVLLGAAYALTGRSWFAIGLHAAWNFASAAKLKSSSMSNRCWEQGVRYDVAVVIATTCYSCRSAMAGSTRIARRAGM